MAESYPDEDDISVTSTALSDQRSEYDVETVLAEDEFEDGRRYLVKWEGYPLERCTWEPASSFSTTDTLRDWKEKKCAIEKGISAPFDVKGLMRNNEALHRDRQDRKRRREAKRKRIAQSRGDLDLQPHTSRPRTSEAPRPEQPRILFGSGPGPNTRPGPARLKSSDHHPGPFRAFNLSRKWKHEKRKWDEPSPNVAQLELYRPSEFPPKSGANLPRRNSNVNLRTGESLITGFSAQTNVNPSHAISADTAQSAGDSPHVGFTPRSSEKGSPPVAPYSSRKEMDREPRGHQRQREDTPALPWRSPREAPSTHHAGPGLWWNAGEVLVHIVYGPHKEELGAARLCQLEPYLRKKIIKQKTGVRNILWFQTLANLRNYENYWDRSTEYGDYNNGWIEGFNDGELNTEISLYRFGQKLLRDNQVAVASFNDESQEPLVVFPPKSRDFGFLGRGFREPKDVFLCTAVKLPRRSQDRPRIHPEDARSSANTSDRYSRPPPNGSGMGDRQPRRASLPHPASSNNSISNRPEPMDIDPAPVSKGNVPRVDHSTQSSAAQPPGGGRQTSHARVDHITQSKAVQPPDGLESDASFDELGINFQTLSAIDKGGPNGASCFYIMFPTDEHPTNDEYRRLKKFIQRHNKPVFSSEGAEDWQNFLGFENGVLLLHEKLMFKYWEPWYKQVVNKQSWVFSLSAPLAYSPENPHFQRLFPRGTVILLTEDFMLRRQEATLIILTWFYDMAKQRFGSWKIMLRPDILDWLETKLSRKETKSGIWLAIYNAVTRLNQNEGVCMGEIPDGTSDTFDQSSVISPEVPGYGFRTENDHPEIPKGLTQEDRDTDHLAEFFSGWALVHSHQFKQFFICATVTPPARWHKWQHVDILLGQNAVFNRFGFDFQEYWAKAVPKSGPSGETRQPQPAMPYTPHTPRAPPSRMDGSNEVNSRDYSTQHKALANREYPQQYR
ncbi:hypothetical protein FE257_011275 [Aspergillus nanangensis]|uniref:Chromo domain-containing protein n=1 Tax=Aspergillus nanangensis TaxID=2582783 RepID=A0AAD4CHL7_ASPNN|nr:hypothetical protein FE257_011275 [Aspergillus nanangensis]